MQSLPPLPPAWVDRIFAKLTLVYGRNFLSQFEGIDIGMVKGDWAIELAGFASNPDAIAFALQNLPTDRPPNVLQFRAICRRAPGPVFKALPYKGSTPPEEVKAKLAELRRILTTPLNQRSTP